MSVWEFLGRIRYVVDHTRPDLLYPTNFLSRFMLHPSLAVLRECTRLLKYLDQTAHYELTLGGDSIEIIATSDASFIHHQGSRSQLGYAISLSLSKLRCSHILL
jgi:hypothetical protein